MVFKREDALKSITDGLAWIAKSCELRGLLRLFDNNVLSHHFFCRLLNGLYGLKLEVMDRIQGNHPAIDLGDAEQRVAYQITTEKAGAKVQHTLDMFVKHGLQRKFDTLRILVIGERQDRYTTLKIPQEIVFDQDKDIIDLTGLLKDAETLSTPLLEKVALVFDEELDLTELASSRALGMPPAGDFDPAQFNAAEQKVLRYLHKSYTEGRVVFEGNVVQKENRLTDQEWHHVYGLFRSLGIVAPHPARSIAGHVIEDVICQFMSALDSRTRFAPPRKRNKGVSPQEAQRIADEMDRYHADLDDE